MVIRCLNFGSLWWLRPGREISDPLRFSAHAAVFNTTGFQSGCRERRLWHIAGVVRFNLAMHRAIHEAGNFEGGIFECGGLERRGAWNRLLLGRRLRGRHYPEKILLCIRSSTAGRIRFDDPWHDESIEVIAASASRGAQETLVLAGFEAEFQTDNGSWEVTWNGIEKKS